MATKLADVTGPGPLLRWVFRMPQWFYRLHLGWLIGGRFLLINHVGAKTGKPRRAVVEVFKKDPANGRYWAASGYGANSHWYRNLMKTPDVSIQLGMRVIQVHARDVPEQERAELMVEYGRKYGRTAKGLMRMLGYAVDGSDEDYRIVAGEALRIVVFETRSP